MSSNPPAEHQPWTPSLCSLPENEEGGCCSPYDENHRQQKSFTPSLWEGAQFPSSSSSAYWDQDSELVRSSSVEARIIQEDWIIEDARRMEDREREDERRKEDQERKLAQLQAERHALRKRAKAELALAKQGQEREEARRAEDRERQDERRRENRQLAKDRCAEGH